MNLSCIIVDDEPLAREILENYVADCPMLEFRASCKSAFEAIEVLEREEIQLMFLDINMPKLSGLSMVRTLEKSPDIIFTTAYPEYAVEGFELDAVDYLVKPFPFERFVKAVNKAVKHFEMQSVKSLETNGIGPGFIIVKADGKIYRLPLEDIIYLEAMGDYVRFHTDSGSITTHDTLKNLEKTLPEGAFLRIHRSHIAAIDRIQFIEGNRIRVGEADIPVGESFRDELHRRLRYRSME